MKKIYQVLISTVLFISIAIAAKAQVTVTNPANIGPTPLAATYTSLALAIADLNTKTTISGPVVITLTASNPQTTPAGGYAITAALTGGSATNQLTIQGSGNLITAFTPQTPGALNDAIFKIIGTDYVNILNFNMQENAANTTTVAATNNMTEWGVALLYASTTNGAQNCMISNNIITLNRTYQNTFGIYSNSTHSATAPTTSATATTTAGGNSGLKIYSNNISNVNLGIVVVGPTAAADFNNGVIIGGSLGFATANTISNFGTTGTFSGYANVSGTVYGILVRNSTAINVSFNNITSSIGGTTAGTLRGIYVPAFSNAPTGTYTNTFNDNTIALTDGTSGTMQGIALEAVTATATSSLNINNNYFTAFTSTVASSGAFTVISNAMESETTNIIFNQFDNITTNTTGSFIFISNNYAMPATGVQAVVSNAIVGAFNKTGAGGTVNFFTANASSVNGSLMYNLNNNFSNVTVTGATSIVGWSNTEGASNVSGPTKEIHDNRFTNITGGTSSITILSSNFGNNNTIVYNNTISNISYSPVAAGTTLTGISIGSSNGGATQSYSNNTISGLSSNGTGGQTIGILGGSVTITTLNINNNTVSSITSASTAGPVVAGIFNQNTGTTVNIFKNKVYGITSAAVIGINSTATLAGNTINVSNNYVSRLYAPLSGFFQAARGLLIQSTVAANFNLYYNTIYLDGTVPTQTYCVYIGGVTVNVPNVNARNNVFVNNVTSSNGAALPQTVYFRLGVTNGTNLAATTNNNILYCGTPSADHLIYVDGAVSALTNPKQTLASYQAFVSTRENLSKTELPPFLNTTLPANNSYLHINPSIVTQAESGAANIATYTDDYDLDIRQGNPGYPGTSTGTAPDIGADEFDVTVDYYGPEILYTALASSVCTSSKTFTATITDYSGVNITAGTLPRVYYKKSTNANALGATNTNTTDGWKYAEATFLGGSSFSFTIDYTLVFGGVTAGDNIQYFVTAQDLFSPVNVGINSGTFAATPTSVSLTGAAFPLTGAINSYSIVLPIPTAITIGVGQTYTTLSGAGGLFADLNAKGLSGNTVVNIIDASVTETGANALNQMVYDCAGPYTLTIKPNAAGRVLTGSLANNALIKIKSSNVIIDGSSNGSTSRDLTITNTSATNPSVVLVGSTGTVPVINTTVKNCTVINGAITATAVVISDGTTLGNAGYFNNVTVQNNNIQKAYIGVYAIAVSAVGNGSGLSIASNIMNTSGANNIGRVGVYVQGVDGANISGNDIGNFESAISEVDAGIWIANATTNTLVEKNTIHDIKYTGVAGYGGKGINIGTNLAAANITVKNNMIYGITGDGDDFAANGAQFCPVGIYGVGTQGGLNIYYNSIYLSGSTLNFAPNVYSIGIALDNGSFANIKDNIVKNELGLLGSIGVGAVGIAAQGSAAQFTSLDYNDYYSLAVLGSNLIGKVGATDYATLAAWQTATAKEANSLNANPFFVSATDLHLAAPLNCELDGYGTPIAGITTDYDNQTRDVAAPDMGADEFNAVYVAMPAGVVGSAVCANKTVSPLGTTYATSTCLIIARVQPSGGSAVSGKINTCVTLDAAPQYFNGEPYVQRHFDIEPAVSASTATATITLYYTDAEFTQYNTTNPIYPPMPTFAGGANTDPNRANVRVTQFHGTPTGGLPTSTPGNYTGTRVLITPAVITDVFWTGSYWAVTIPVTGFSGFYAHTTLTNAPLPISVNYLNGRKQGSNHLLDWKVTCVSTPKATMTLQRSSDARNYTGIYTIVADAARCASPFDYTDASPLNGMNYYRLKIVDVDGNITYSTTVALLNAVKGFDIISIAPNPVVSDDLKLNVASAVSGKMEIVIFDMQGRLVNSQSVSLVAGFNSLPVNVANLSSGTYTIRTRVADDQSKVIRFVKQ